MSERAYLRLYIGGDGGDRAALVCMRPFHNYIHARPTKPHVLLFMHRTRGNGLH